VSTSDLLRDRGGPAQTDFRISRAACISHDFIVIGPEHRLIEESHQNSRFRFEYRVHGWDRDVRAFSDSFDRHPREAFGAQEPISGFNYAKTGFGSLALASDGSIGALLFLCQWLKF
jgi:hypothetical protein